MRIGMSSGTAHATRPGCYGLRNYSRPETTPVAVPAAGLACSCSAGCWDSHSSVTHTTHSACLLEGLRILPVSRRRNEHCYTRTENSKIRACHLVSRVEPSYLAWVVFGRSTADLQQTHGVNALLATHAADRLPSLTGEHSRASTSLACVVATKPEDPTEGQQRDDDWSGQL